MIRHILAAGCFALVSFGAASAQEVLPRRATLGAAVNTVEGGVQITRVVPGSAAAAAGLAEGDIITRIGDRPVVGAAEFVASVRASRAGRAIPLAVLRAGAAQTLPVTLTEAPRESAADLTISYESVRVDDTLRRTLIAAPRSTSRQRRPAMLLVGGIGCYSIDDANAAFDPYRTLAHDLARRGVIVMRIDKSGMGDSQGPACATVDFAAEARSYQAALAALRADRRVDASQVFVFGHSIGATHAPLLAAAQPVAGVIGADGAGLTWIEYDYINARRQAELAGASRAQVDATMILKAECTARVMTMREPVAQVFEQRPECAEITPLPASQDYMIQLTQRNPAADWGAVSAPALIIYGDSDFLTTAADHERIAAIINEAHPGNATLSIIEDMDHYVVRTESQQSSFERAQAGQALGEYDQRFSQTIGDWICARARCTGGQTATR
jgi:pimeloyl-ACP methyl ester carboxylesterase